jgi:hypothetical protein
MCNSVEQALKDEFGFTLASAEVVILDPAPEPATSSST